MTAETIKHNWTHKDNLAVYEEVSLSFFEEFAKQAGLDDHCDLKQIDQYIKSADSILEVGGGSGRVLDYFKKINYAGDVTAVEWSKPLYDHLQNNYGDSVDIVHTDIMDYHPEKKFDLIVWMWGGINDFSQYEQINTLKYLSCMLRPGGIIAFDTIASGTMAIDALTVDGKNFRIACKCAGNSSIKKMISYYLPSLQEIIDYARNLASDLSVINFTTRTKKDRKIHVLQNSY